MTAWNDFLYSAKVLSVGFHLRILNQSHTRTHAHSGNVHAHTHTFCHVKNSRSSEFMLGLQTVIDPSLAVPPQCWLYLISQSQPRLNCHWCGVFFGVFFFFRKTRPLNYDCTVLSDYVEGFLQFPQRKRKCHMARVICGHISQPRQPPWQLACRWCGTSFAAYESGDSI